MLTILNGLPHPVLVVDGENRIDFANSASEVFFQASSTLLQRERLETFIAFASPLLALINQVRRTGSTVNEYGVDLGSPRLASQRLVDIYVSPLAELEGRTLVMLQERTMAQMIERQLTHRGAARTVSGMAAVLAHEIKNPLSGIRGAAQLLEDSLPESERTLAQLICTESDRICGLVDRMEVFGDERPLTRTPVNIHDVLDHVKKIAVSGFARHIRIVEDYDPSLPPVPGDRDRLIQAFLNLVKNAAEAIGTQRSDGRIILNTAFRPGVRLSVPGAKDRIGLPLQICVEDNGPGVPEDLTAHLFDPFVTTKQSGTGLGLALVAKIVGDHGGIIECDSRPPRTLFRVLMPMHRFETDQTAGKRNDDGQG
ncbi:MAG: nitrogen regulation protein NR(II) [Alphaproteobacteria bacterium]|nr:MAG: nitrogen regulation protein NR(II) [Alphaproteobacteria bacterium]